MNLNYEEKIIQDTKVVIKKFEEIDEIILYSNTKNYQDKVMNLLNFFNDKSVYLNKIKEYKNHYKKIFLEDIEKKSLYNFLNDNFKYKNELVISFLELMNNFLEKNNIITLNLNEILNFQYPKIGKILMYFYLVLLTLKKCS